MGERLTLADIAEQSGEDTSFITRCETGGLLEPSAADGYSLRDAGRVRLVRLLRRGIDLLLRHVYSAAVGGTEDQWGELDAMMAAERHTAVLVRPVRVYSNPGEPQ